VYIEDKSKVIESGLVFWIDPLGERNRASKTKKNKPILLDTLN